MPGATALSSLRRGVAPASAPSIRFDRLRAAGAPGRSSVGCADDRRRWSIRARPASRRRRRSDRCGRAGRPSTCCGRGRRHMARAIGRRRHDRLAERGEKLARDRMRGHAQRDGVEAGGRQIGDRTVGAPSATPVSAVPARIFPPAARPLHRSVASRRAAARSSTCAISGLNCGPALGRVEPRHGLAVGGVGAEPVDGLGRKRDQPAGREHARGLARSLARQPLSRALQVPRSLRLYQLLPRSVRGRQLAALWGRRYNAPRSRSVAQSGSAPRSGRGGRRFKSCHSDQFSRLILPKANRASFRPRR